MKRFNFRHPVLTGCVVIAGALACLYSVSLGHNFLFDEESIILENPLLREPGKLLDLFRHGYFYREDVSEGLWMQYYRPLTAATFVLDYAFWKLNPLGYNLTNLALFTAACLLLFRLVARMTKSESASFFAVLLFSVHTIHTESVTYIASRGDLLGMLFLVGGLLLYWESRLAAALVCYFFSLFCKESMLLMPLYFLFLDVAFFRRPLKPLAARLLPFVAAGAVFVIYRKYFCPVPMGPPALDLHQASLRFLSMGFPLLRYFEALLAPEPFRFCDSIDFAKRFTESKVVLTAGVYGLLLWAWARSMRARGPVFFGLSLFGLSLGPYLQIVHFYPQWAEHYFLGPFMGLTILLAAALKRLFAADRRAVLAAAAAAYVFFLSLFCLRTFQRNLAYNDTIRYYELLSETPTPFAYYGYTNLGRIAAKYDDWPRAGVYFKTALAMEHDSEANWNNMGAYWMHEKEYGKAYESFKKAYEMGVKDGSSLQNAAVALLKMGRYEDSLAAFEAVQKRKPKTLSVYSNLILNSELVGDPRKAMRWAHRGVASMRGRPAESALALLMAAGVAYREGWDSVARHAARRVAEDYPDAPLFGEMGRLLDGKLGSAEFIEAVRSSYAGFSDEAWSYVLMARVLAGDRAGARDVLAERKEDVLRSQKDPGLLGREIERAETLVKG